MTSRDVDAEYDVLIVGAGPAGCTLAYLLADAGRRVLVVDRTDGPSFKVGESLLPAGVHLCHQMGLKTALEEGGFKPKLGARFVLSETGDTRRYPFSGALRDDFGSLAYQVKRLDFDTLLYRHARDVGAEFLWGGQVTAVDLEGESGVSVKLADGERVAARFLADGTGQVHLLARHLGLHRLVPGLDKVAMFAHFENVPPGYDDGDIIAIWNTDYWVWVIPFADGTTSIGVVGDPRFIRAAGSTDQERFDALCSATGSHRRSLEGRRALLPLQRRADFSYECETVAGPRHVLIGDAAGFVDPIFSTGVFLAQKSAFLAAEALLPALAEQRELSEHERAVYTETLLCGVKRFMALVKGSYENRFIETAVGLKGRPGIRRAFTSLLAGDVFDDENPIITMGVLGSTLGRAVDPAAG
jgi:flavin-dependent dehydrogenase